MAGDSGAMRGGSMTSTAPRPDTSEMVVVHDAFRDTLSAAQKLVESVDAGDGERVALLRSFYDNVIAFLIGHHEGEDELIYPLLVERAPEHEDLIRRVNAQHDEIHGLIESTSAAVAAWTAGDAASQSAAAAALDGLGARLAVHLGEEEREMLPLCEEHVSVEEWGALPGHVLRNYSGDKVWLVLGLIRERMSQAQRDAMLQKMPPPVVEMWTGFGENAFRDLMAQVGPPLA
jgi:hemerythrin-like domain-containing protein